MKKLGILVIVVLALVLISCDNRNNSGVFKGENYVDTKDVENWYEVVVIEDCEYILYTQHAGYTGFGFMAHKGNCNNPIHK